MGLVSEKLEIKRRKASTGLAFLSLSSAQCHAPPVVAIFFFSVLLPTCSCLVWFGLTIYACIV